MRNGAVAGHAERAWSGLAFSRATHCLKSLTSARADENTELEPRELADRNEILAAASRHPDRGSGTGGNSLRSARESRRSRRHEHSCNGGERVFKKVSHSSLQQTTAAFVFPRATTSGEEQ